jgi:hypothetical protein
VEHVLYEVNKGTKEVIEMERKTEVQDEKVLRDNKKMNTISHKKRGNGCCGATQMEFIV